MVIWFSLLKFQKPQYTIHITLTHEFITKFCIFVLQKMATADILD